MRQRLSHNFKFVLLNMECKFNALLCPVLIMSIGNTMVLCLLVVLIISKKMQVILKTLPSQYAGVVA